MKHAFFTVLGILVASQLSAAQQQCPDPLFTVSGDNQADLDRTCDVAMTARSGLAQCGVMIENPILIELRGTMVGPLNDCLGIYHCGEDRIEILAPDAMPAARITDGAFAQIHDDAYWDSVLFHELAHAVYDRVACPFSDCLITSEYVGYTMQVLFLPDDQRALFGQDVELQGKPTRDKISAVLYFLAPDRFAKYAWLHFQSRPDPCVYMGSIMKGDIHFDREDF